VNFNFTTVTNKLLLLKKGSEESSPGAKPTGPRKLKPPQLSVEIDHTYSLKYKKTNMM
jgi:hypothetical protein